MVNDAGRLAEEIEDMVLEDAKKIYTERTLEEAFTPKNLGEIKDADGFGKVTGPCGDTMQISLEIKKDRIINCKFLTDGCGSSAACGSVVTELVKGKSLGEASRIDGKSILSILGGLPKESEHCAYLAANTLKAAIDNYRCKG